MALDRASDSYHRLVNEIYPRMVDLLLRRYQRRADKSLRDVYAMDDDFLHVEAEILSFAGEYQAEIVAILDDPQLFTSLVHQFVLSTLEFTYANNQFVYFDQNEVQVLERIYRAYLLEMQAILQDNPGPQVLRSRLDALVTAHFADLSANISRFFDPGSDVETQRNFILRQVVCREYSPAFQLEILGIHPGDLVPPVLDLGCGKSGRLVQHLHRLGLRAFGVDRLVDDLPGLRSADWLTLSLQPGAWGSILSHMAFSNHFIFNHLYRRGDPQAYARQYMAVLGALQPGGSFYYSPGLPFIERLLPATQYAVTVKRLAGPSQSILAAELQDDALYTTRVTRLA
ncbi:MAG: hypothetical protein GYA17_19290 [Chloroflexi bacterium]|nr:hypothetical protein [Chloroflexota bacterium]